MIMGIKDIDSFKLSDKTAAGGMRIVTSCCYEWVIGRVKHGVNHLLDFRLNDDIINMMNVFWKKQQPDFT